MISFQISGTELNSSKLVLVPQPESHPPSIDDLLEQAVALGASRVGSARDTARAVAAANIDTYEASIRALTELEWSLARAVANRPISSLLARCADLTRDITAMQVSTVRWMLDL